MSEEVNDFGADDLGGPKNSPPSASVGPSDKLLNENIAKKTLSRWFAAIALGLMSLSAISCLAFSFYIGCHFIKVLDDNSKHEIFENSFNATTTTKTEVHEKITAGIPPQEAPTIKSDDTEHDATAILYLKVFSPLIPASFSTALALILFITIARFVTNFERSDKESEESGPQDYGAIAVFIQEVGKLISTLRGKG